MSSTGGDPARATGKRAPATRTLPTHLKFAKLSSDLPHLEQRTPSQLAAELKGLAAVPAALRRPQVVAQLNMAEFTHCVESVVPLDEPLFQPSPPEIVFDAFEPLRKYTATLLMRNNDNVNRRIKILAPDSSVFSVEAPKGLKASGGKVAPGMDIAFKVHFEPRAWKDFEAELHCITERERFLVTVRARGPRACFEFPDGVDFGLQPVRINSEEAFLLRNTGASDGRFALSVPPPFSVTPLDGSLAAGAAMQILFSFHPEASGAFDETLTIEYDTGERAYSQLSGASAEVEVTLQRSLVVMDACYLSLVSQRTVKLQNNSDVKVTFDWKANEGVADDARSRMRRSLELAEGADTNGLGDTAASLGASTRLRQQRRAIDADPLLFEHASFSIEPSRGEIYPGGYCELTISFRPASVGEIAATAYCEVSGRESRLPLMMQGVGLGPKGTWLYDTLDIGDVFVNSRHRYEVVLDNHGEIDADYSLQPHDSLFAHCFKFTPSHGTLRPREDVCVEVAFCCDRLGEFAETFTWTLASQPQPLPLTIKGRVVGPSFHFSVPAVDFGVVSLGFLNSTTFYLHNTSDIPMRFALRIPEPEPSPTGERQFQVVPASGAVLPHGKKKLTLELVSATVTRHRLSMLVDIDGVGSELLALPITADCVLPALSPSAPSIDFGDAFRHHPYTAVFAIRNASPLPAKFEVVPQDPALARIGAYTPEPASGLIDESAEAKVKVTFAAARLGPMCLPLYVRVAGTSEPAFAIDLKCTSVGPRVSLGAEVVDWGKVSVLTPVERTVALTNDSLIPAEYRWVLRKPGTAFSITEMNGTLAPGEVREVPISAYLDDTVKVTEELLLQARTHPQRRVSAAAAAPPRAPDRRSPRRCATPRSSRSLSPPSASARRSGRRRRSTRSRSARSSRTACARASSRSRTAAGGRSRSRGSASRRRRRGPRRRARRRRAAPTTRPPSRSLPTACSWRRVPRASSRCAG